MAALLQGGFAVRRRVTPKFWIFMIAITVMVFSVSFGVLQYRFAQGEAQLGQARGYRDDLILETDIAQVITHCEEDCAKLTDPETGHFFGHKKIGNMTYWAEYLPKDDGYELFHAYCHRMCLEAEDGKNG